jgi:hypothetical protein
MVATKQHPCGSAAQNPVQRVPSTVHSRGVLGARSMWNRNDTDPPGDTSTPLTYVKPLSVCRTVPCGTPSTHAVTSRPPENSNRTVQPRLWADALIIDTSPMKPPSKLCTTRYRPLIAGCACIARLGDRVAAGVPVGPTAGSADGERDPAALGGSPLARPDSPGRTGTGDGTGVDAVGPAAAVGTGSAGGRAPSGAGLRPRDAPRATTSRTTITTTPAPTTIQGDDAIATGPCDGRGERRMPDMNLPQRTVRAA